jgi:hypothetical protein
VADVAREKHALSLRHRVATALHDPDGHHVISTTVDGDLLREVVSRLAWHEDENDALHDDLARLLRERNTLAEECSVLGSWVRRAASQMTAVLHDHEDGLAPIAESSARALASLIGEAWDDGEDDDG